MIVLQLFLLVFTNAIDTKLENAECFCKLSGYLDDCSCEIPTLDQYNNVVVFPQIHRLMQRNFFRFYKANTGRKCKYWNLDWKCRFSTGGCTVEACKPNEIPTGIKGDGEPKQADCEKPFNSTHQQEIDKLSKINRTISSASEKSFEKWSTFDLEQTQFCDVDDEEDPTMVFVDLLQNPERFTGYDGEAAHKVWRAIYEENCFQPEPWPSGTENPNGNLGNVMGSPPESVTSGLCLEKRIFYRAVSGLHSSISIHLSAIYRQDGPLGIVNWKMNLPEFQRRFNHKSGSQYIKNLYFVYLIEMRAFAKAAPYLAEQSYFTGDAKEDEMVKEWVKKVVKDIVDFPMHFDESLLFRDDRAKNLKNEFRIRFHNVTSIIDCAACEKCRLWGKLQTQGLGTALKILFTPDHIKDFKLKRNEIVSLFNAFGRLSTSIHYLELFQKMMSEDSLTSGQTSGLNPFPDRTEL